MPRGLSPFWLLADRTAGGLAIRNQWLKIRFALPLVGLDTGRRFHPALWRRIIATIHRLHHRAFLVRWWTAVVPIRPFGAIWSIIAITPISAVRPIPVPVAITIPVAVAAPRRPAIAVAISGAVKARIVETTIVVVPVLLVRPRISICLPMGPRAPAILPRPCAGSTIKCEGLIRFPITIIAKAGIGHLRKTPVRLDIASLVTSRASFTGLF